MNNNKKSLWKKNIISSIVFCPICGKQLKIEKFNSKEEYGWKIIDYNHQKTIVCMTCK